MPYVGLNDLNMFYEEFGKGDALLFLHSHFSRGLLAFSAQIIPFQRHYHCFFSRFSRAWPFGLPKPRLGLPQNSR